MIPDLSRDQITYLIYQFIFSRRDREMLIDRLLDGMTYDQLAEKYDMSVRQVRNIIHRNKEIVFQHSNRLP